MPGRYDHFRTHWRSRRLAGHDYAAPGWYFVTICTKDRLCLFGEVRDGVMGLDEVGCVAHACWASIPEHVEGVHLDAFVVMPNHVHGLIGLAPARDPVAPLHATALPMSGRTAMSTISPTAGSLSAIVRSYKSAVTRAVRPARPAFAWQPRFHDHVVRSAKAFHRIRAYVEANPAAWERDRLHPDDAPRR